MEPKPELATAIERVLSHEERERALKRLVAANPRWSGATVADAVENLADMDAHLYIIESMYEEYGTEVPEKGLLRFATLAVALRDGPENVAWEAISDIIDRVRTLWAGNVPLV